MPYTWDDFYRDFTKDHLDKLTIEERLKGLPVEARHTGQMGFNPTMVRFRPMNATPATNTTSSFNPTMVRFRPFSFPHQKER